MRINCLHLITALALTTLLYACIGESGFSEVPEIDFISVSKDTMIQGNLLTDSIDLVFAFRDGDGDIGTSEMFGQNIQLIDSRTDEVLSSFKTPPLPIAGSNGGIEGTITLKVFTQCCLYENDPNEIPCVASDNITSERFQIDIQLTDDTGNRSNVVTTNFITLLCD
jgi:hypothetical protein